MVICEGVDGIEFVLIDTDSELFHRAQRLRHDVYKNVGYTKGHESGIIPDEKDDAAEYIIALKDEEVVGTLRMSPIELSEEMIAHWNGHLYLGAEEIIREICRPGESAKEVGALAVNKEYRKKKVSSGLYKAIHIYSLMVGIRHWLFGMDRRALKAYERQGWRVHRLGSPIDYVGSISELGVVFVEKQFRYIHENNPNFYKEIVNGF